MPEYLAPGVYVEEVSFRPKTIEGVSTSVAGFIGQARYGPVEGEPELLTSFADFARIYGGIDRLTFNRVAHENYLAHAVRSFFDNGGSKLYVTRVYEPLNSNDDSSGYATGGPGSPPQGLRARFPGASGDMTVTVTLKATPKFISTESGRSSIKGIQEHDVVYIKDVIEASLPDADSFPSGGFYDVALSDDQLVLRGESGETFELRPDRHRAYLVTISITIRKPDRFADDELWEDISPSLSGEKRNSIGTIFAENPDSRALRLTVPLVIAPETITSGAQLIQWLMGEQVDAVLGQVLSTEDEWAIVQETMSLPEDQPGPEALQTVYTLEGGDDGRLASPNTYRGRATGFNKTGLETFADLEEISIVAAPGYSADYAGNPNRVNQIAQYLISHCERMRYRIAVLDAPDRQVVSEVRDFRARFDSTHAALYYPWVTMVDPLDPDGRREIDLPPSGFVAGIYARNDAEQGVHKAPANEVVRGAIGFEVLLNKSQQDILNPEGINCFRFFEGRGYRLWGARTISSDPEWKYVNLRRYFAYLERSIEKGTQWVVFSNNSNKLWDNVRRTVDSFLFNEWKSGHLMGEKPEQAFFVKCDMSTMTRNDIDNGRLVCLIGVAPVRPAEFVIFRIGQWTADSRR
jgi:phage tail sheath protein FI